MRYPNLRYGNPTEFQYYAMGRDLKDLSRSLRRDERTIRDWLSGRTRVPWWVPEIMRLRRMEADLRHRQMFWAVEDKPNVHQLGVVGQSGQLHLVDRRRPPQASPITTPGESAAAVA
jgi:hypothetical protein